MATATTQCDVIRDFAAAWACGLCAGRACSADSDCLEGQTCAGGACTGRPANCPAGLSPALCAVPDAANKRMALFADRYDPATAFMSETEGAILAQEERDLMTGIQADEAGLAAAYPGAAPGATTIGWQDFNYCLWNPAGTPGGAFNNRYFERNDAQSFGMKPVYPVGGALAEGTLWPFPKASPVPLAADYVANPDLVVIFIFVLLVVILAILLFKARRSAASAAARAAARAAESAAEGAAAAAEAYPDPTQKCRQYAEAMEAQGFDMGYYRQRCGLGP